MDGDNGQAALEAKFEMFVHSYEREQEQLSRAVNLQNSEMLRRLEDLNHAHQRAVEDKAQFLTINVFNAKYDDLYRRIDSGVTLAAEANSNAKVLAQQVDTIRMVVFGAVGLILVSVVVGLLATVIRSR